MTHTKYDHEGLTRDRWESNFGVKYPRSLPSVRFKLVSIPRQTDSSVVFCGPESWIEGQCEVSLDSALASTK